MAHILAATLLGILYPLSLFLALRRNSLWRTGLILNSLLLLFLGYIQFYIVFACILLAGLAYLLEQEWFPPVLQRSIKASIALLALLLGFHLFPGFEKIIFLHDYTFYGRSAAFDVAYPVDKALGAVLLLGYGVAFSVSRLPAFKAILITTLLIVGAALAFAVPVGYLGLDIKFKWLMLTWAYGNLFITCVAEESFFRGVIQHHLYNLLKDKSEYAAPLALFVSAATFALAHYAGGVYFIVIAFIAGLGYAAIYAKTRNLLDSILVHFLVNLTQIVLLTYPYLNASK